VGGGEYEKKYIYVYGDNIMSSLHHRNNIGLLLNQLKQLNDLDHTAYAWWDVFHLYPDKEDEAKAVRQREADEQNALATPIESRTAKQKKILQRMVERSRDKEYDQYVVLMAREGVEPVSRRQWDRGRQD
jgi:hypothetical protein